MIYHYSTTLICVFILQFLGAGWSEARPAKFHLVKEGKHEATVVISLTASEAERFAAGELRKYVERMSAVKLPIRTDDKRAQGNLVLVGTRRDVFLEKNKIEIPDSLGEEDFVIRVVNDKLFLIGGGDWGTVYAVYTFLEHLGCRWFMPGPFGEVVPRQQTVAVHDLNIVERPSFKYRRLFYFGGTDLDVKWQLQTKSNNFLSAHGLKGYEGFGGHAYESLVPPAEYFDKHPEYFAFVRGVRRPSQICLSNPDVFRIVVEKASAYFDAHPGRKALSFSLSPNDSSNFCEDDGCLKLGPTVSDRVMSFVNRVARAVGQTHPDKLINVYAYDGYIDPPRGIETMENNVAIIICRITQDGVYSFPIASNDQYSERIRKTIEGWAAKAHHILFYDYYAHYDWFAPWPVEQSIAVDLRYYHSFGPRVEGLVPEMHPHWGTQGLTNYVMAKFSWNVNLDIDSLVNDYYAKFYGGAAKEVKAYFDVFANRFRTLRIPFWGQMGKWGDINTPEVLNRAKSHLTRAKQFANDSSVAARMHLLELAYRYVETKTKFQEDRSNSGDFARALHRLNEMETHIKSLPQDEVLQSAQVLYSVNRSRRYLLGDIARLEKNGVRIDTTAPDVDIAFMKDWYVIGPFSNADNKGWGEPYPPEEEIDVRKSYDGKNGKEVKWRLVQSSTNRINLDTIYADEEWAVAYAVSYVYSPKGQRAFLALGSDDGIKAWMNGERVGANQAWRTANAFQDVFPATLKKGWNLVLLKITQGGGEWGFYASVVNDKVRSIPQLKYAAHNSQ